MSNLQHNRTNNSMNERTAEIRNDDLSFTTKSFKELAKGDVFRLRDPDGCLAHNGQIFIATSDTYLNKQQVYEILCDKSL